MWIFILKFTSDLFQWNRSYEVNYNVAISFTIVQSGSTLETARVVIVKLLSDDVMTRCSDRKRSLCHRWSTVEVKDLSEYNKTITSRLHQDKLLSLCWNGDFPCTVGEVINGEQMKSYEIHQWPSGVGGLIRVQPVRRRAGSCSTSCWQSVLRLHFILAML